MQDSNLTSLPRIVMVGTPISCVQTGDFLVDSYVVFLDGNGLNMFHREKCLNLQGAVLSSGFCIADHLAWGCFVHAEC